MSQDRFAQIRPYNDDEVRGVLDRLLRNAEFIAALTRLRFPRAGGALGALLRPIVRLYLGRQLAGVASVAGFQQVVEKYMTAMIEASTTEFTVSGLERLDPARPCLFIGNHRDIALDPAFVNYALYASGWDTVRIAIGDNLLTKDYVADLMRLNKSFIVRRSAKGPRQMLGGPAGTVGAISVIRCSRSAARSGSRSARAAPRTAGTAPSRRSSRC